MFAYHAQESREYPEDKGLSNITPSHRVGLVKRINFVIILLITIVILHLYFTQSIRATSIDLQKTWGTHSALHLEKVELLQKIRSELGYNGFIHHFKNYVIRRNSHYLSAAESSMFRSLQYLNELQSSLQSPAELDALKQVRGVIWSYQQKLSVATARDNLNLPVVELYFGES